MTVPPLPVAPRPFPDETLRSWADRVGAWYELSGTELVNALRKTAYPLEESWFISLEDCEHDGITPGWVTALLADAARLPHARVQVLTQDDYARWIPPYTLWNVLATSWPRRCQHCLAASGEAHHRRAWRSGWVSGCPAHGIVLGTRDQALSPYAVRLETALQEAIVQGGGWVCLPWPVAGQPLCLPVSLVLETLAAIAEYLWDKAETLVELKPYPADPRCNRSGERITVTRLIDVAAYAAEALPDILVSNSTRGWRGPYWRSGLSGSQHHGLMAGLGWLLSDWPDHLIRLLWCAELDSLPIDPALQPYLASGEWNFALLQARAAKIAWPWWRQVASDWSDRVVALKKLIQSTTLQGKS
jgi:hypothetical protein